MMRNLMVKLRIIESLEFCLDMTKEEFKAKLDRDVQPGSLETFNSLSEMFSKDYRPFIGSVRTGDFSMKLKRKTFSLNRGIATIKGKVSGQNDKLIIKAEINGFHSIFPILLAVFGGMYVVGFVFLTILAVKNNDVGYVWGLIGLFVHMIFISGLLTVLGRAGVKKMKSEFSKLLN